MRRPIAFLCNRHGSGLARALMKAVELGRTENGVLPLVEANVVCDVSGSGCRIRDDERRIDGKFEIVGI